MITQRLIAVMSYDVVMVPFNAASSTCIFWLEVREEGREGVEVGNKGERCLLY